MPLSSLAIFWDWDAHAGEASAGALPLFKRQAAAICFDVCSMIHPIDLCSCVSVKFSPRRILVCCFLCVSRVRLGGRHVRI